MSLCGPMNEYISEAYLRVILSSSFFDISLGLQMMPPLAPPNGMPTTVHFQVIHIARALTSSNVTLGWYLMPPLHGPRAELCWTRNPVNMRMDPLSIFTGMLTVSSRLGRLSISIIPCSMPISLPTRST